MTDLTPEKRVEWREDAEYDNEGVTPSQISRRRILALLDALAASETARKEAEARVAALRDGINLLHDELVTIGAGLIRASYDDDAERMAASLGNGSLAVKGQVDVLRALLARVDAPKPDAGPCCRTCTPAYPLMLVCSTCGNKRCPHARDHANRCTASNEPDHFKPEEA